MSVVHIHFRYDLVEGDAHEAKRRIADDAADSIPQHLIHHRDGSPRDLVTVVFHDMEPEYSLAEYFGDEIPISVDPEDPGVGRLKNAGMRMLRVADRPVGAVAGAGRALSGKARIVAEQFRTADRRFRTNPVGFAQTIAVAAKARVGGLTGAAVSQTGRVGGETYVRLGEFSAALNEAIGEHMKKLDRNARELRGDPAEWCKATAASVGAAFLTVEQMVPSFGALSPAVKAKFAMAGLRGAWRPVEVAQAFFEEGIPSAVRNLGENAVLRFVDGKHASHIRSVFNAPDGMLEHANIVWEAAKKNLARGPADMTPMELAKANALNVLDATGIVAEQAVRTAATAGCIGMALGGVVSLAENYIYVYKGEMDVKEGAKAVGKDLLKKGGGSAIGGVGWTVAVSLGAGPAISVAAPVIVTIGGATYVVASYRRIKKAWDLAEDPAEPVLPEPSAHALGTA